MYPRMVTVMRHFHSEHNAALDAVLDGDEPPEGTAHALTLPDPEIGLSALGFQQGEIARSFMSHALREFTAKGESSAVGFPRPLRGFVSPYRRAQQSAGLLRLGIPWVIDTRLHERSWGPKRPGDYAAFKADLDAEMEIRIRDPFIWRRHGGDSLAQHTALVHGMVDRMCRDVRPRDHVFIATHAETILSLRIIFEHMTIAELRQAIANPDSRKAATNGKLFQYRVANSAQGFHRFTHMRTIDPLYPDDPMRNLPWTPLVEKVYTDDDLVQMALT